MLLTLWSPCTQLPKYSIFCSEFPHGGAGIAHPAQIHHPRMSWAQGAPGRLEKQHIPLSVCSGTLWFHRAQPVLSLTNCCCSSALPQVLGVVPSSAHLGIEVIVSAGKFFLLINEQRLCGFIAKVIREYRLCFLLSARCGITPKFGWGGIPCSLISWDPRMVWVGRVFKAHPVPAALPWTAMCIGHEKNNTQHVIRATREAFIFRPQFI